MYKLGLVKHILRRFRRHDNFILHIIFVQENDQQPEVSTRFVCLPATSWRLRWPWSAGPARCPAARWSGTGRPTCAGAGGASSADWCWPRSAASPAPPPGGSHTQTAGSGWSRWGPLSRGRPAAPAPPGSPGWGRGGWCSSVRYHSSPDCRTLHWLALVHIH